MDFHWKSSPLFLKYQSTCWTPDQTVLAAPIIDEGIASPNPVERAHWLLVKAGHIAERPEIPDHLNRAWDTVEAALATAMDPDLREFRIHLLMIAQTLLAYQGPTHRLTNVLRQVRPGLIGYLREPGIRFNIAILYMDSGRFRRAQLWYDRAFQAHYLETKSPMGRANALAGRAWNFALLGQPEQGEADLAEARRLYDTQGEGRTPLYSMGMAVPWMALRQGRLPEARALLQEHMIKSPWRAHPLHVFQSHVLAARLALAEGNQAGYRHYCDQARAVCDQHDLTLSREFLRVVMADAEREFGPVDPA